MINRSSSAVRQPLANPPSDTSTEHFGTRLKTFLTALMGLLSILVFGLGLDRRSAVWLWIAFVCALISGVFAQLLIDRRRRNERFQALGK